MFFPASIQLLFVLFTSFIACSTAAIPRFVASTNPKVFCNTRFRFDLALPPSQLYDFANQYCSTLAAAGSIPGKERYNVPMTYPAGRFSVKMYTTNMESSSWDLSFDDCKNLARELIDSCTTDSGDSWAGQIHASTPGLFTSPPLRVLTMFVHAQ